MKRKKYLLFLLVVVFLIISAGCRKEKVESSKSASTNQGEASKEVDMKEEGKEETSPGYVKGEVLLKFKQDVPKEESLEIISEYGCAILSTIEKLGVYRLKIPEDKTVPEMIDVLEKDERVKYAEPNVIYKIQE